MYVVETKNLVKKYDQNTAVDSISIKINKGDSFGLLGPNGAGKSTTINMLCGLLTPTSGEVYIMGDSINKMKNKMGYVPQSLAIYNEFTAYENLSFFGQLYKIKGDKLKTNIDNVLEFTGLLDAKNKKAKTFSGGMLRRLNIACSLVHQPEIVIMDEPTVGIDPQSRNHIMSAIKKMKEKGVTIIYTSHYMEEVETLCDKIAIIDNGKVITEGTKAELKALVTDKDTLDITVDDPNKVDFDKLNNIRKVSGVHLDEFSIQVTSEKGANNLNEILNCIMESGARTSNIGYKEVNLETVFLALTGKKLRD